jgi:hypothetical protein
MEKNLINEYRIIKKQHESNLIGIAAKVVLGSSVIRVFCKGTKQKLYEALKQIKIKEIKNIKCQKDYEKWFKTNLNNLSKVIKKSNPESKKHNIYPGYKWGHAAKILNLFIREIVENRRYFNDKEVNKIRNYLYMPIDSKVIKAISKTNVKLKAKKIKDIATKKEFDNIQKTLGDASLEARCPRIWFDDVWGIYENNKGTLTSRSS